MALISIRQSKSLGASCVLAPERYDPRRSMNVGPHAVLLSHVADNMRETVNPGDGDSKYIILDTSDVHEGIVVGRKQHSRDIGSSKKMVKTGDVIISRLRPYLRQAAHVDDGILNLKRATLVCSTEFFVLRAKTADSIAFLVPFLLSNQVQKVLAASQEGGHHPRFDQETLMSLPIPEEWLANRVKTSGSIEAAINLYRESERTILQLVDVANTLILSGIA